MKLIRILLFPLTPIYYIISWLRNVLYNKGLLTSKSYSIPVVCVGNLSVGGTGKTPMIEYLIRLFKQDYKLAVLSRGYKRQSKGFVLANKTTSVDDLGDEPFQFHSKFGSEISIAVDANRQRGIAQLIELKTPELILLDDAYQHRKVKAKINVLLTTFSDLFVHDFVLPLGNLREPRIGYKRAQLIVVSKCPSTLSIQEQNAIKLKIKPKTYQQIFFSTVTYETHVKSANNFKRLDDLKGFALVTGIANANDLVSFLKSKGLEFKHFNYPDHYAFKKLDIQQFMAFKCILTTEKDYTKLSKFKELEEALYYLPITIKFLDSEPNVDFNSSIIDLI